MSKKHLILAAIVLCAFVFIISGCSEPKQNTKPGEFGHYIYKQQPNNVVDWHIIGMYLNDSLIVVGNPMYVGTYSIYNLKTGKIENQKYTVKHNE